MSQPWGAPGSMCGILWRFAREKVYPGNSFGWWLLETWVAAATHPLALLLWSWALGPASAWPSVHDTFKFCPAAGLHAKMSIIISSQIDLRCHSIAPSAGCWWRCANDFFMGPRCGSATDAQHQHQQQQQQRQQEQQQQ